MDSLSVELGFRIPIVNGIPDSLSCSCIPDSKSRIPDSTAKICWIPNFTRWRDTLVLTAGYVSSRKDRK